MEQGGPGRSMIVLLRGQVKIEQGPTASRLSTVAYRGEGDVVGEMSLVDDSPRSARVSAISECHALQIRKEDFQRVVLENPATCLELLKSVMNRLREATEELTASRAETIEAKVLRLMQTAPEGSGGTVFINQTQFAKQVGCSREALNRNLQSLVQAGRLQKAGRGLYRISQINK